MASLPPHSSDDPFPNYEHQFSDRIRKVAKGGGRPAGSGTPSANGSGRGAGALGGIIIAVIVVVGRIALNSNRPNPPALDPGAPQRRLDDLLRAQQAIKPPVVFPPAQHVPGAAFWLNQNLRLEAADVPLLRGLCYRVHQESRQPGPTPGKQIFSHLDGRARDLLRRAAFGEELGKQADEFFEALNETLGNHNLYDRAAFAGLPVPPEAILLAIDGIDQLNLPAGELLRANRALLEVAYPRQVLSVLLREPRTAQDQKRYVDSARHDLAEARRKYEGR
jgi:hypothetical protein